MDSPTYVFDENGFLTNDAVYIITGVDRFLVATLNSPVSWYFLTSTCTDLQNGFLQAYERNQDPIPIPTATSAQKRVIISVVKGIENGIHGADFERLTNALVYELFFPEELHGAGIRLFDALAQTGLAGLAGLTGDALVSAASALADTLFAEGHPVRTLLSALDGLEVVRLIEGGDA